MNLHYLTPLTFPSRYVNRLQVMKMSAAFTKHANFSLYIAESRIPRDKLFHAYNVQEPFPIKEVGLAKLPPRRLWQARKFLPVLFRIETGTVWYIRDVLLADWLCSFSRAFRQNYFFELHTLTRFSEKRYYRVLSRAKGIITTNEAKKKDMIQQYGISAERILVAQNGVDFEECRILKGRKKEIRKELGIEENIPLVVYAGTDAKEYGTDILRDAQKLLRNHAKVFIISGKPRNEALKYMAAADVLVAPYLPANEHFIKYMSPMKLREYMAMERPIVVSNLPSIYAFMPTDDYAFFAEAGNYNRLAHQINYALEHKEEALRRAQHAYHMAWMSGFSWDNRAEQIIKFIKKLV